MPTVADILHPEDGSEQDERVLEGAKGRVQARYTLSDPLWIYLQNYAEKHRLKGNGFRSRHCFL